jgi:hypothetical protein
MHLVTAEAIEWTVRAFVYKIRPHGMGIPVDIGMACLAQFHWIRIQKIPLVVGTVGLVAD